MGMKPSDTFCIPLCRTCHTEVHKTPDLQQLQPEWIELTLQEAVIEFDGVMRDELVDALEFVRSKRSI